VEGFNMADDTVKTSSIRNDSFNSLLTISTDDYKKFLRSNGIYSRNDLDQFNVFYRFPRIDPYNAVTSTREYVFFTKPDLHIFNNGDLYTLNPQLANVPFFYDLKRRGYNTTVLRDLQYSADGSTPFVRILSNRKTSNLDLSSISVDDAETAANLYGTKLFYRKASDRSDEEADFSIEFEDNKYLDVYSWFKAFDEYEKRKYIGKVTPPNRNYTQKKVLHDQMTIYKFIVGEDGETIIHWAQMIGCYPKTVPREIFSDLTADGHLRFTIQWKCTFQDDMQPNTISDFNYLASISKNSGINVPIYDSSINAVSGENVLVPYISLESTSLSRYQQYKLKWRV
jgi:hypothetical protein